LGEDQEMIVDAPLRRPAPAAPSGRRRVAVAVLEISRDGQVGRLDDRLCVGERLVAIGSIARYTAGAP
jgi:hypothetical protein